MDSALLSILGTIVQAYASILAIVGMYIVFSKQRTDDQIRVLKSRRNTKSQSLIDFINREIAPAYTSNSLIRVDVDDVDAVIEAIERYRLDRKSEIPQGLDVENLKGLVTLWAIVRREKEELFQLKSELSVLMKDKSGTHRSLMLFVLYFMFELAFALFGMLLVYLEVGIGPAVTGLSIILAAVGLLPLGNLFYRFR